MYTYKHFPSTHLFISTHTHTQIHKQKYILACTPKRPLNLLNRFFLNCYRSFLSYSTAFRILQIRLKAASRNKVVSTLIGYQSITPRWVGQLGNRIQTNLYVRLFLQRSKFNFNLLLFRTVCGFFFLLLVKPCKTLLPISH